MPNDLPLPVRPEPYAVAADHPTTHLAPRVLHWLPPPERLAAPLRLVPEPLLRQGSSGRSGQAPDRC